MEDKRRIQVYTPKNMSDWLADEKARLEKEHFDSFGDSKAILQLLNELRMLKAALPPDVVDKILKGKNEGDSNV